MTTIFATEEVTVRHTRQDPVFVIGHGRSGTSILTNLIRKYLGVAFGTESQFFVRYYRRLSAYGDLNVEANLERLLNDIAGERFFARSRKFGLHLDVARAMRECKARTYAAVLDAILRQCADAQRRARWGDKTPEYIRHLPVLLELFPRAQFIHIVRDGRDVALSGYQTHFGCKNAYTAAREWRSVVEEGRRFGAALPPGAFVEIRYEDLLRTPADVMARLVRFLEIDDAGGSLTAHVGQHVRADLRSGNSNKWEREMDEADQMLFAALAGDTLRACGYKVPARLPPPPGQLAAIYWESENIARRLARADYWQDNLYKARLRLQHYARLARPKA